MNAECPTCGESFGSERGMKVHHSRSHGETLREKGVCEYCGDEFSIYNPHANANRYCSRDCKAKDQITFESRECEMCGRSFRRKPADPERYCCHTCSVEDKHSRPRPDGIEQLLWLLYRYEGFSIVETYRRQRAVLGIDECLTEDETRDLIHDMGITREYNSARWTLQDLDPDAVGDPNPEGDESYKRYYQEA